MNVFTFTARDEADAAAFGRALSAALPNGSVVALIGPLGAGKTRLVQAVAEAEGIDPRDAVSPTFVLVHEYRGRRSVFHFDAYRVKDEDEFLALGSDDYFADEGLTFVEWADRVPRCLPRERIEITIEITGPTSRRLHMHATGPETQSTLAELETALKPKPST